MKKQYINYLLVTLVLSLCILLYFRTTEEGFQASPVDLKNFTGQLTGIRFKVSASTTGNPASVFKGLLGNNLQNSDVQSMFERCNGDQIAAYYAVDSAGPPDALKSDDQTPWDNFVWPEFFQNILSPSVVSIMLSGDQTATRNAMMEAMPIYTMNFTRNSKIVPLNLVNQNIPTLFNNIYGNLQKAGVILHSVILDRTNEYPRKVCANNQAPALTPKISVNAKTELTGLTVQTSVKLILQRFNLLALVQESENSTENVLLPNITTVDEKGNTVSINLRNSVKTLFQSLSNDTKSLELQNDIKDLFSIKTYTIRNLPPITMQGIVSDSLMFSYGSIYTPKYSSYFYTDSPYLSDSAKQAYYTQLFMGYNAGLSSSSSKIPISPGQGSSPNTFTISAYHLSNPEQDVTIGTEAPNGAGSYSGSSSGSEGSLLQSLRKLLCV